MLHFLIWRHLTPQSVTRVKNRHTMLPYNMACDKIQHIQELLKEVLN